MVKKVTGLIITLILICVFSAIVLAADEYEIKKIKIIGNEKVHNNVILALLPFEIGELYSKEEMTEKAQLAVQILNDEKLFFNVNVFPLYSDEQQACNVLVEISGEWTYQFGFGVMPWYIMVEDRAFLGESNTLGTELSLSKQKVYFADRYILAYPVDVRVEVYNQTKTVNKIFGYEEKYYALKGFGGSASLAYKFEYGQSVALTVIHTNEQLATNLEDSVLDTELGLFDQKQIKLQGKYLFNSVHGYGFGATAEVAKLLNENLIYASGNLSGQYTSKLVGDLTGAIKLDYGITTDQTPYYQLFNINHLQGVRGVFNLAPNSQKLLLKSEIAYPVFYGIEGVAFLDIGNTWNWDAGFAMDTTGIGYGLGLRYRAGMPINTTFRLEAAMGDSGIATYFVIGEAF